MWDPFPSPAGRGAPGRQCRLCCGGGGVRGGSPAPGLELGSSGLQGPMNYVSKENTVALVSGGLPDLPATFKSTLQGGVCPDLHPPGGGGARSRHPVPVPAIGCPWGGGGGRASSSLPAPPTQKEGQGLGPQVPGPRSPPRGAPTSLLASEGPAAALSAGGHAAALPGGAVGAELRFKVKWRHRWARRSQTRPRPALAWVSVAPTHHCLWGLCSPRPLDTQKSSHPGASARRALVGTQLRAAPRHGCPREPLKHAWTGARNAGARNCSLGAPRPDVWLRGSRPGPAPATPQAQAQRKGLQTVVHTQCFIGAGRRPLTGRTTRGRLHAGGPGSPSAAGPPGAAPGRGRPQSRPRGSACSRETGLGT